MHDIKRYLYHCSVSEAFCIENSTTNRKIDNGYIANRVCQGNKYFFHGG